MANLNKIKKSFSDFNFHKVLILIVGKGSKIYRIIFILLLLISLVVILLYWYKFIINYEWSEEQKREYIILKKKREEFNEDKFFKVIEESQKNKQVFTETFNPARDIFKN